ncbi:glycosyltransferase family 117 protein [Ferruginibacter albus]|uniref:glycosyltransferase family 117 protein n=1 Tax=Ferruginibacter albus TaxID=2875540 RepID=UPI001CC80DF9|nr:DUF2723 domain-containing protein [Ferruginibacter albus]UAY52954.1 DUF2723 domain-containing protein [Ferruginibacter albus]
MNYKRINNITGLVVLILASLIYLMTMEATGSFWDCGEFASSAYKLQIPHPPGAPLFVIIGRLFMAFISNPHKAIIGLNTSSALASAFTILFLFWSITHFAKKILTSNNETPTGEQTFIIMAAGVVGAFAYAFCDSFWYSAVESEVYAMSSFFTAIVFWAILKWENAVTEEQKAGINGKFTKADRWLILIFYLMGLSIGVHLLNLLTIPAIVMIYYYKRYNVTTWGIVLAFIIGCVITGTVQKAVLQWTINWAGDFDILFVNSFGLPFFSGFAFFFILLTAVIIYAMRIANKKNWNFLKLGLWIFSFMLLGYTSYFTTLIRSKADVAIDMFNVDNPVSLVGYLSREQYGDWPILYGQDFTAEPISSDVTETYVKGKDNYIKNGRSVKYVYADEDMHIFPRMWDQSNDQSHADYYAGFCGITRDPKTGEWTRKPTMGENISFFVQYQTGWMFWRYFMWNFAGKQDDIQGILMNNVRDGNWKTGITFWDNARLGNQDMLPESLKKNKSNNNMYALPLILGILGIFYHVKRDKKDALVVGLLFFFTGIAILIYLNPAMNQPRERDYAVVGAFYAYAIWIGLGVLYVKELFSKFIKGAASGYAAAVVCILAVPVIMGMQEWDDHDRSNKTIARDLAIDYLESCPSNAILVSYGDNDTYPLWYAQEVEGIRRDVRVINQSLLGTDWYINELRYKINQSDPIDPIWTADQIQGPTRDAIVYSPISGIDPNQYMDLYTVMHDYAGSDDPSKTQTGRDGNVLNVYPTKKFSIPVDVNFVRSNGTVNADDSVLTELRFETSKGALYKNDAAILNMIAGNKWKRPICFTQQSVGLGFDQFLRQDGLTYRLVPVANPGVNRNWAYDKLMKKFAFGNCDKPGVYYDEENRRHLNSIRFTYANIASDLADAGRKDDAKNLLERCDKNMLQENFPYGMVSRFQQQDYFSIQFLEACYKAGDFTLADKVKASVQKDLEQQVAYYSSLGDDADVFTQDNQQAQGLLNMIKQMEQHYKGVPAQPAAVSKDTTKKNN